MPRGTILALGPIHRQQLIFKLFLGFPDAKRGLAKLCMYGGSCDYVDCWYISLCGSSSYCGLPVVSRFFLLLFAVPDFANGW